jgi:hypothetical protein
MAKEKHSGKQSKKLRGSSSKAHDLEEEKPKR